MILFHDLISNNIKQWINVWNSNDIDVTLSLYSNEVEFTSPIIKKLFKS
jgi:hypothetical protein